MIPQRNHIRQVNIPDMALTVVAHSSGVVQSAAKINDCGVWMLIEIVPYLPRKVILAHKNIEKQTMLNLKDLVEYQEGQVVSKTLVQNDYVSMTIFSFDKGEEISTHAAGGDAMVTVLEGKGRFTVADDVFYLEAGQTLIMPKDIPHAVYGEEKFKMQLVVSY